jgi:hypothetical protein
MKMSHIITYYTSDHAIGWSFPQPGLRGWSAVAEPQLAGCVMATIAQHGILKLVPDGAANETGMTIGPHVVMSMGTPEFHAL